MAADGEGDSDNSHRYRSHRHPRYMELPFDTESQTAFLYDTYWKSQAALERHSYNQEEFKKIYTWL